jgi:hypothetical protein
LYHSLVRATHEWLESTLAVLLVFYAVFFASEALLGVSGILAVVTVGLGMGWYSCVRILVVQHFVCRARVHILHLITMMISLLLLMMMTMMIMMRLH